MTTRLEARSEHHHLAVVCGVLLLALCLCVPGTRAYADDPPPAEPGAPKSPEDPPPPADPTPPEGLTPIAEPPASDGSTALRSRGVADLAREHGLSSDEALILQPVLNELRLYKRARIARNWQHWRFAECKLMELKAFRLAVDAAEDAGRRRLTQFNNRQKAIADGWDDAADWDPSRTDENLWRPPSPPYGWLNPAELPRLKKAAWDAAHERDKKWGKREYVVSFPWPNPGVAWLSHLESRAKELDEQREYLRSGPGAKAYRIRDPFLGWVTEDALKGLIKKTTEQIPVLREQIRDGTLAIKSDEFPDQVYLIGSVCSAHLDSLVGWVTKQQILDKISELEKKKKEVYKAFGANAFEITRDYIGTITEQGLLDSIEDNRRRVKEMSDTIHRGEYEGMVVGLNASFTRTRLEEVIRKIEARIEEVRADDDYHAVVDAGDGTSGWASLPKIAAGLKDPHLTSSQRAGLIRGKALVAKAKKLEIQHLEAELRFWRHICSDFAGTTYSHWGDAEGYKCEAAMPAYFCYEWDCSYRKWVQGEFSSERHRHGWYYVDRIRHLEQCLKLF